MVVVSGCVVLSKGCYNRKTRSKTETLPVVKQLVVSRSGFVLFFQVWISFGVI